jgi:O-antigen/teichoic acid export membrane protein
MLRLIQLLPEYQQEKSGINEQCNCAEDLIKLVQISNTVKNLLPKSDYAKNSIISILGVGVAALIPLAIRPFLGRMFTPEEFNLLGLYVTLTSILAIAANFRYGYAVVVTSDDEEARGVLLGSIVITGVFSFLTFIVLLIFGQTISLNLGLNPDIVNWFYFVPLSVFFISVCIGFNGWLNKNKHYKAMAFNKSIRRGGEGLTQFVFGKLKNASGLIYGAFLGDLLNFFVHLFQFKKSGGSFKGLKSKSIFASLKKYKEFPLFNFVPALLDIVSLSLPFLIVNAYYSEEVSGQFYQSRDILAMPLILISTAISQVLMQKISEKKNNGEKVFVIIKNHIYILSFLGLIGFLVVFFLGENLFTLFLGDQWKMAGSMASMMVLAYSIKFVVSPISVVFFSLHKIKIASFWQAAYFLGILSLVLFANSSIESFILYYVIIEVVFYAIYAILIIHETLKYDRSIPS